MSTVTRTQNASAQATLFGVPARFMRPRLLVCLSCFALVSFGLLMVFSASSVTALLESGNASYYLIRQALSVLVGLIAATFLARVDYHVWSGPLLVLIWVITAALLFATALIGITTKGATRWISLGGGVSLQASEFAKVTFILVGARLSQLFFEDETLDFNRAIGLAALSLGLPLVLIVIQPDKGTTMIIVATLIVMLYLSGISMRVLGIAGIFLLLVAAVLFLGDDYSRQRIITMFNPQADPYDAGYQLLQGFYAFANGGIGGVGIGLSRQKYAYLPEAHNDFIFAIIGEETGFIGAVLVIVLFVLLVVSAFKIAQYAPDLSGRLIASGAGALLIIQMMVNIGGVLGIIPLTGKPLPFLSYGGSSMISSLMLVGLIVSVSRQSRLPETQYDRSRKNLRAHMTQDGSEYTSGAPVFTLVEGGSSTSSSADTPQSRYPSRATPLAGTRSQGQRNKS